MVEPTTIRAHGTPDVLYAPVTRGLMRSQDRIDPRTKHHKTLFEKAGNIPLSTFAATCVNFRGGVQYPRSRLSLLLSCATFL